MGVAILGAGGRDDGSSSSCGGLMARSKVKWKFDMGGFAELRNHPVLVASMEAAMRSATAGTPFEVETWAHQGRRAGPRTVVQAWARAPEARRLANEDPAEMQRVLSRLGGL